MSGYAPGDLEPSERPTHDLLTSVRPQALPHGFRDRVMQRVAGQSVAWWEWVIAAALAVPSIAFLVHQVATHGEEFTSVLNNVVSATTADSADAFFFIDGTTVLALTLIGAASLIAAHAAIAVPMRKRAGR